LWLVPKLSFGAVIYGSLNLKAIAHSRRSERKLFAGLDFVVFMRFHLWNGWRPPPFPRVRSSVRFSLTRHSMKVLLNQPFLSIPDGLSGVLFHIRRIVFATRDVNVIAECLWFWAILTFEALLRLQFCWLYQPSILLRNGIFGITTWSFEQSWDWSGVKPQYFFSTDVSTDFVHCVMQFLHSVSRRSGKHHHKSFSIASHSGFFFCAFHRDVFEWSMV
jgi:hypothetical protein